MTKTLTIDCSKCNLFRIEENNVFKCTWGRGKKSKVLLPPKGKKQIKCNLKRE